MTTETTPVAVRTWSNGIEALRARVRGEVILPESAGYDEARAVWNGAIDRHPAVIVRCADVIDVIGAVNYARQQGLTVAVRSGGHSIPGYGTTDGGIIIDLSLMKAISIDPVRRVAWVQPGLTWGEYAQHAQAHGLATSSGDAGSVGVGGLTIGGGIGWMVRKHGLTIDHLLSVELVTAEGRLIRASADEHPDLFWALRGGGGNFGVVTAYELKLEPTGTVLGGAVFYPIEEAAQVIAATTEYVSKAPDELTVIIFAMPAPPAPFIPEEAQFRPAIAVAVCYAGDLTEGERVVAPLRSLGTPIADIIGPMPYPAMFALTEDATVRGRRHTVRSMFLDEVNEEMVSTMVDYLQRMEPPFCMMQLRVLGGAMARVDRNETAFAHRDAAFMFSAMGVGEDPAGAAVTGAWAEHFYQAMRPHAAGVYVNFLGDEGQARVREAYSPETMQRLQEVKRAYDPENCFRLNQNIRPR